jgi:hypothetical protein
MIHARRTANRNASCLSGSRAPARAARIVHQLSRHLAWLFQAR